MTIHEIIAELKALVPNFPNAENTVDTIKAGNGEATLSGIAVSMFATPDVIKQAARDGANLLIVHEPVYYNHRDTDMPYPLCQEKKALIEQSGLTVFRFHDYAHHMLPDLIYEGQLQYAGLAGRFEKGKHYAVNRFILDEEMTTLQLAETLETRLSIQHLRIAGCTDNRVRTISCCFGTPGHVDEELAECDVVLTGEICEWALGEYVRDLSQLGYAKSLIVMGHYNSEKAGMRLLADRLSVQHPDLNVQYYSCGDVYRYTK